MKNFITIFLVLTLLIQCKTNQSDDKNNNIYKEENANFKFPKQLAYVSDFENILTKEQNAELSKILSDYEIKTGNQIAIVSISENLNAENFDEFALDLSNNWGVGTAIKNNGLTIVFSEKLRKIRICTGYGTEKILTDQICENILNKNILPEFKKGNHFLGLKNGIGEFIEFWK